MKNFVKKYELLLMTLGLVPLCSFVGILFPTVSPIIGAFLLVIQITSTILVVRY
jgi:hypothetical protein